MILREDTVQVPVEAGKTTVDVTSVFPWITNVGCFVSAHAVETTAGVETYAIPGARLRFDANRVLLTVCSMPGGGPAFPVRVLRPSHTWVKPEGSPDWGESTTGPTAPGDQVAGDEQSIALVAAFHVAEGEAAASVAGSAAQLYWLQRASALAARTPFLRDQRTHRARGAGQPWPDLISPYGPTGGKTAPYFR